MSARVDYWMARAAHWQEVAKERKEKPLAALTDEQIRALDNAYIDPGKWTDEEHLASAVDVLRAELQRRGAGS